MPAPPQIISGTALIMPGKFKWRQISMVIFHECQTGKNNSIEELILNMDVPLLSSFSFLHHSQSGDHWSL